LGRLKLIGHVREELDRLGIEAESIQCRSGGLETAPGIARLTIVATGSAASLDFTVGEIEDCEMIVAGEIWYKIAALIENIERAIKREAFRSYP
jgi:hypothetical protein